MEKFETALPTKLWNDILGIMNKTSLSLQNSTMTMDVVTKLHKSLISYVKARVLESDNYQKTINTVPTELRHKDVGVHMPVALGSYKRCKLCSTKTNDKRSKVKCETCDVALCILPCFRQFVPLSLKGNGNIFLNKFPGVSRFFFLFS